MFFRYTMHEISTYKTNNIAQKIVPRLFMFTFIPTVSIGGKQLLDYKPGAPESQCQGGSVFAQLWNQRGIDWFLAVDYLAIAWLGLMLKGCERNPQWTRAAPDCACPCLAAELRNPRGIPQGEMMCKWTSLWQCQRVVVIVFTSRGVWHSPPALYLVVRKTSPSLSVCSAPPGFCSAQCCWPYYLDSKETKPQLPSVQLSRVAEVCHALFFRLSRLPLGISRRTQSCF